MGQNNCCSYDPKNPEGEVHNDMVPQNASRWTESETKACIKIQASIRGHQTRLRSNKVKTSKKANIQVSIPNGMELNYENESVKVRTTPIF